MSASISWTDYQTGVDAYLLRSDKLRLPNGQTLKGLRFDRAHIENILADTDVTHLYLSFIESPQDDYVTVVAGGMKTTDTDPNGTCDKNNLYDYAEPCPSKCPVFV